MTEQKVTERRAATRLPTGGSAAVRIRETEILGPSRNVSPEGIYFIAEAEIPVEVRLPNANTTVSGKIVRIGAVRDGELGIAIRFDEPLPPGSLPEIED